MARMKRNIVDNNKNILLSTIFLSPSSSKIDFFYIITYFVTSGELWEDEGNRENMKMTSQEGERTNPESKEMWVRRIGRG